MKPVRFSQIFAAVECCCETAWQSCYLEKIEKSENKSEKKNIMLGRMNNLMTYLKSQDVQFLFKNWELKVVLKV